METTRKIDEIIFREDLYPRFEPDPQTIQRYAEDLEVLPPIIINQHNELIDGYHRWTAHKKAKAEEIKVKVVETRSDREVLELAIKANAAHGLQLSRDDKRNMALKLYTGDNKHELAKMLSVSVKSISRWVEHIDKAKKEERDRKIREMWMACYTQEEIAETTNTPRQTIADHIKVLPDLDKCPKSAKLKATYEDPDWQPPLYNIWTFHKNNNKTKHFGNTAVEIVDRLLYMFTKPFEIVVDPFGGGGSTIDICKERLRRYWVSDRLPIPERKDIRQYDIAEGAPPLNGRWKDVSLVYLDPPYWRQAENQYSSDSEDLGNMQLDEFYNVLVRFMQDCAKRMRQGSHIALIIQPTQWKADNKEYIDHVFDLVARTPKQMKYKQRIICPYSTEQYNAQQVNWAKENKQVLTLNRELIIWEVTK